MDKPGHGGARGGAGGLVLRPPLDKETARTLRTLVRLRGWKYGAETAARLLAELIEREWRVHDAEFQEFQAGADEAYEGGVSRG